MKTSPPRPRSAGKPRKTSPGFAVAPAGQSRKPEKTRHTIPASALRKTGPLVFLGFRDVPKVNVSRGKPPVSGFLNQAAGLPDLFIGFLVFRFWFLRSGRGRKTTKQSLVFWFSRHGGCSREQFWKTRENQQLCFCLFCGQPENQRKSDDEGGCSLLGAGKPVKTSRRPRCVKMTPERPRKFLNTSHFGALIQR